VLKLEGLKGQFTDIRKRDEIVVFFVKLKIKALTTEARPTIIGESG